MPQVAAFAFSRVRLHSTTTFECSDEVEEARAVSGEFVVSGGDAPEVLDLVEEAFDEIAVFVEGGIEASPLGCCGSARNDGFCSAGGNGIHRALAGIALVGQNMVCPQSIKQTLDLGDVVAFATGQDETDRVTQGIGGGMDLGAQPALGASQRVSFKPIFGSTAFFGAPALC